MRSLAVLLCSLLLAAGNTVHALDCEYAIQLYETAAADCRKKVVYQNADIQPCTYARQLHPNYKKCSNSAKPIETQKQSRYGVAVATDRHEDKRLTVGLSHTSHKHAERAAVRECIGVLVAQCDKRAEADRKAPPRPPRDPSRYGWMAPPEGEPAIAARAERCKAEAQSGSECKKLGEYSDDECFGVAGARFGTSGYSEFFPAKGSSLRQAEVEAFKRCKRWRHPQFNIYEMNNPFPDYPRI